MTRTMTPGTPARTLNATRGMSASAMQARLAELESQLAALRADLAPKAPPSAARVRKLRKPVAPKTPRTTTRVTLRVATAEPQLHPELEKNTRGTRAQAVVRMPEHNALRVSAWYDLTDAGDDPVTLADMSDWAVFARLDDVFGDALTWAHATIALGTHDARFALGAIES